MSSGGRVRPGPGETHSPSRSLPKTTCHFGICPIDPVIRALLLTRIHSTGAYHIRDWSLITGEVGTTE